MNKRILYRVIVAMQLVTFNSFAQDQSGNDENEVVSFKGAEGFHIGFYLGAFFPNKETALIYNGYGYDENGNRKDFASSFMHQKIVYENEPANGFTDRIGPELGVVNHEDWRFNETDMPVNLKYNTSFLFGIAMHYGLDKKQASSSSSTKLTSQPSA